MHHVFNCFFFWCGLSFVFTRLVNNCTGECGRREDRLRLSSDIIDEVFLKLLDNLN